MILLGKIKRKYEKVVEIIKKENTLKRDRASKKLIEEFNITNARIAEIFNISKQRINEGQNKTNLKEYDKSSIYLASDEDINLIKKMIENENYIYEDNKYKIELMNDYNGKFAITLQNIKNTEETKIFFYDDIKEDIKWKQILHLIHKYRLDVLQPKEKIIIKTGKKVYVTEVPFLRPDYKLFHRYKNIRKLNEEDYVKFLGFNECKFLPQKYKYTDDIIKELIKKDIDNKKMKIKEGKLHIPSDCTWIRSQLSRQKQLTGRDLSIDEFVRIYGYEKYNNRDKSIKNLTEKEVEETDKMLRKTDFSVGEKEAIVKIRIGQGIYKKMLLEKYEEKCCICNLCNKELLIASHIKEWKNSDLKEKCDINNGLLLCSLHDSLFDKHLISFDNEGNIIISEKLSLEDRKILGITQNIKINMDNKMEYYMKKKKKNLK